MIVLMYDGKEIEIAPDKVGENPVKTLAKAKKWAAELSDEGVQYIASDV